MDRLLCGQVFILDDNKNPLYPQFVAWRATLRQAGKPVTHIRLGVQYNALYKGEPLNEAEMKINIECVRLHLRGKHAALPQSIRILVCVEFDDLSWRFADITMAESDDERFLEVLFQIPRLKEGMRWKENTPISRPSSAHGSEAKIEKCDGIFQRK